MLSAVEPQSATTKARILIVEDEGLIARDIQSRLLKAGYEVAGVVDAGEAVLEKVAEVAPDLILMDIRLRGEMDGIQAAKLVRERYDLPIIYLTAHTDRETLGRAKLTGPCAYLAKPIGQASLPTSIEVALYRHQMERELRQQRAWLRTTLETMTDAVIVTDRLGHIHSLNPAAERLTGWPTDEALNRPLAQVLKLVHLEDGRWVDHQLARVAAGEESTPLSSGIKLLTRRGERISIEGEIAACAENGTSLGAVVTLRDVTRRDHEEQERRHDQKMEAVSRLAAGVAHDFNNYLTVILGHAALLLNDGGALDRRTRNALEQIKSAGTAATAITRQLLMFGRNRVAEPQLLSLNSVIERNESFCRRLLGPGIEWKAVVNRQLKTVYADSGQLTQILLNLVTNAREAMPEGGTLTVSTECVEDHVVLTVADTGVGMDGDVVDRIFEPFFTTKRAGGGTGLGLSMVYTLVKDLGGTISVDSQPGRGSTFRVSLPVAEPEAAGQPEAATISPQPAGDHSRTVLLVDDNAAVRTVLRRYLEGEGYTILEAGDGNEALGMAALYDGTIDVLVTDVIMPKMNGFRLAEELTRIRPNVRTLFVSGYAGNIVDEARGHSANGQFLQKPFLRADLVAQVKQLFDRPVATAAPGKGWSV